MRAACSRLRERTQHHQPLLSSGDVHPTQCAQSLAGMRACVHNAGMRDRRPAYMQQQTMHARTHASCRCPPHPSTHPPPVLLPLADSITARHHLGPPPVCSHSCCPHPM